MKRMTVSIPALLAIGLSLGAASTSFAQQPSGAQRYRPQVHINLFTPQGSPLSDQQRDHYRYVVPATPRYGAYYTYENGYYYTPAPPRGPGQQRVPPRPVQMEFGASKHLAELAERIEWAANELCLDLHYNYRHNPGFDEIYREAYQLLDAAKFIHDRSHHGDRQAIRKNVTQIDNLFHHVQEEVSGLKRHEHRPVGQHDLQAKTEELQALIHHLMFDQGVKPDHDKHRDEHDDVPPREEAPPPRR